MSWTSMTLGLPNTAAIVALILVPIAAVVLEPVTIAGSAGEPTSLGERTSLESAMLGDKVEGLENDIFH